MFTHQAMRVATKMNLAPEMGFCCSFRAARLDTQIPRVPQSRHPGLSSLTPSACIPRKCRPHATLPVRHTNCQSSLIFIPWRLGVFA